MYFLFPLYANRYLQMLHKGPLKKKKIIASTDKALRQDLSVRLNASLLAEKK